MKTILVSVCSRGVTGVTDVVYSKAREPRGANHVFLKYMADSLETEPEFRKAAECNSVALTSIEKYLCNDWTWVYVGDYYHVIASAFLTCRRTIAENQERDVFNWKILDSNTVDELYLDQVRSYKQDRFTEEARGEALGIMGRNPRTLERYWDPSDSEKRSISLVKEGLSKIKSGEDPSRTLPTVGAEYPASRTALSLTINQPN